MQNKSGMTFNTRTGHSTLNLIPKERDTQREIYTDRQTGRQAGMQADKQNEKK